MQDWKTSSYRYLFSWCQHNGTDSSYVQFLHPDTKPIYEWCESFVVKNTYHPTPQVLINKFNLKGVNYDPRELPSTLGQELHAAYLYFRLSEVVLDLNRILATGDLNLGEVQATIESLTVDLNKGTDSHILSSRDYIDVIMRQIEIVREGGILYYGFPRLDNATGGIKPAQHILVFAPTHAGKSVWTRKVAVNLLKDGKKILYITLENTAEDCLLSCLSLLYQCNPDELFERANISPDMQMTIADYDKLLTHGEGELLIRGTMFTNSVREIEELCRQYNPHLVILDQMSHFLPQSAEDRVTKYSRQSSACSAFARTTRIPIIVVAQAKKGAVGSIEDTGWAYQLIQDARVALFINNLPDRVDYSGGKLKSLKIVKADHKDSGLEITQCWNRRTSMIYELTEEQEQTLKGPDGFGEFGGLIDERNL